MKEISLQLLSWFETEQRNLPWRLYQDPYHTIVSEYMLQQTQVKTVIPYFQRFISRFPDIKTLAESSLNECLIYWQGLGYYKRCENLHQCAQQIMYLHHGIIPQNYEELRSLKGIGDYIASAICAIAFNQNIPVVDGNVLRVLSRLFLIDLDISKEINKKQFKIQLEKLIPKGKNRYFAQAMMELGALVCTPKNPSCHLCPISINCKALKKNVQLDFPVNHKENKISNENKDFKLIKIFSHYLLVKRSDKGLLSNLWEFPDCNAMELEHLLKRLNLNMINKKDICSFTHRFTHLIWKINAELIECTFSIKRKTEKKVSLNKLKALSVIKLRSDRFIFVSKNNFKEYPHSKLIQKIIEQMVKNKLPASVH